MNGTVWTSQQIALLSELYPHNSTEFVAQQIGRSAKSCFAKAHLLGLRKTKEYLFSPASGRTNGRQGMATRFKPGHQTWNKGMKGLQIGGFTTRFKPGQMPHNNLEVGSYRVSKDGVLQKKIGTERGSPSKRWRSVHELVWVEANGPVPAGHIVVFKKGMRTATLEEITLDRIECISLAENMLRNTHHNYGPEIAKLVQLKGAITRVINKRTQA